MPDNQLMASSRDAIARWAKTVRTEHEQADCVRSDDPGVDSWKKLAHRFVPADRAQAFQDETLIAVMKFVRPDDTVLDVGAGAGRLAIPLAEKCRQITAVEPSEAMRMRLTAQAESWNVSNLKIVDARWPDLAESEAEVEPADVVICAHVIYTAQQIEPFLRKLAQKSKRDVIVIVFEEPAMANYFPLWELVYGEERIALPCLPELKNVLEQIGMDYDSESLPEWESRPFEDADSAYEESLARLFLSPGSPGAEKLASVLPSALVPFGVGLRFKWSRPHRPWLVRWSA